MTCVLAIDLGFCDTPRVLHSALDFNSYVSDLRTGEHDVTNQQVQSKDGFQALLEYFMKNN